MEGSRTSVKPSACFPAWAGAGKARDALGADLPNLQLPRIPALNCCSMFEVASCEEVLNLEK
jgi:hypothetical protein